jgi:hypothetical protein
MTITNPAAELVTSPATETFEALWVDPRLSMLVNLGPCENDNRPLKHLFRLPQYMSDSTIADNVGGLATLTMRKATPGQLVHEVQLAREGQGIFKKGRYYLLYPEGKGGALVTVSVHWHASDFQWYVCCFQFGSNGPWLGGDIVLGN